MRLVLFLTFLARSALNGRRLSKKVVVDVDNDDNDVTTSTTVTSTTNCRRQVTLILIIVNSWLIELHQLSALMLNLIDQTQWEVFSHYG